jgi:carbon-monoxide dehydrogenase medium subunit
MSAAPEVLFPSSPEEAVAAFGDGSDVTVIAGGTIVMPEISYGRRRPRKALLLARAGLAGVRREGGSISVGATTPVAELEDLPAPIGPAARGVADVEVRAQGTVGGNLCARSSGDFPRGDLQAPLLALSASVRVAGPGGERTESLEEFLEQDGGALVLEVSWPEPAAGGYARVERPHTHAYTALAVSAARTADGTTRIAATGVGPVARRLPSAEQQAADPEAAGRAGLADVELPDDALASSWYRQRTLPVLVRRALTQLQEAR